MTGKTNYESLNAAPATNKNQLNGFCHDAAGNLGLNSSCPIPPNPYNPIYVYDAENRLTSTAGYTYVYDGDGKRVKKASGAAGTLYWTGMGSDAISEGGLAGTIQKDYIFFNGKRVARRDISSSTVHYYFSDHLGSTSLVTDAVGTMSACPTNASLITGENESDYYPYGGEQVLCNRVPQNYKFTGKERDAESNLDQFGARYYASSMGRFMTPDWAASPTDVPYAEFGNPQSLNLYGYVKNNPTTLTDPNGHCWSWAQSLCNAVQIGVNYWAGNGAKTNAEVAHEMAVYNRTWYVNHAGGNKEQFDKMTDKQVNDFDKAYQNGDSSFTSDDVKFVIAAAANAATQWGWQGQQSYNEAKNLLNEPNTSQGTVDRRDLLGKVPTKDEAVRMIEDAGGKVERIEGGHAPGGVSPHENPHINYTTASGAKGTIDIQQ